MRIDCLQYANWSEKIFRQMREGNVDAVHVTIAYHENFRETVLNVESFNRWFEQLPDVIFHGKYASDVRKAQETVNRDLEGVTLEEQGRHDPCVVPRAVPMVEAMMAIVLCDHLLRHRGQCG